MRVERPELRWLVCAYCRSRWNTAVLAEELHLREGIQSLVGTSALSGASEIDSSGLVTVKREGCGATVTITLEDAQSRMSNYAT